MPDEDICALVPLQTVKGLAVAPAANVVTEGGGSAVHCFFKDAGGETVAGISPRSAIPLP